MEISLIENLQRENLRPIEEAEALDKMVKEHDYTQKKLALALGKSQPTISETLSLNRLPEEIKNEYRHADISRRIWVEVAKRESPKAMTRLLRKVQKENLSSDQVRQITKATRIQNAPVAIALKRVQLLTTSLSKLDITAATEDERSQLIKELKHLRSALDRVLS